jgi:hypothetical protein
MSLTLKFEVVRAGVDKSIDVILRRPTITGGNQ